MSVMGQGERNDRPLGFAGDLFRQLATDGRLRMNADLADRMIIDLERTLAVVETRLRLIRARGSGKEDAELSDLMVEALFQEQVSPGLLESAAVELPKYLEALRQAGQRSR